MFYIYYTHIDACQLEAVTTVMRVLIVDAFGPSPRSRKKFQTFERVVTSSLKKSLSSLACGFTLLKRGFHSLDGFDLSIPSKYAMTLREIDKLDLVFIDGDMRLLPWRAPSNKLLMLIKVCIMAQKCVFAAASASLFMAHLCACGCRFASCTSFHLCVCVVVWELPLIFWICSGNFNYVHNIVTPHFASTVHILTPTDHHRAWN